MLEDVLGWVVVLVGAIVMRFTSFYIIDPLMSIGVAIFIIIGAIKNLKEIFDIILQKTPCDIDIDEYIELYPESVMPFKAKLKQMREKKLEEQAIMEEIAAQNQLLNQVPATNIPIAQ